jgi:hypothetical protein
LKERGLLDGGRAVFWLASEGGFAVTLAITRIVQTRITSANPDVTKESPGVAWGWLTMWNFLTRQAAGLRCGSRSQGGSAMHQINELSANWDHLEANTTRKEATGLLSGFYDYDRDSGLHPGEMTILAAALAWETSLALNVPEL